jgi:hypothetical protein
VLSASLYIIACSAKNHVRQRLRRLREPRYLIGTIAGAAYLYVTVFLRAGGSRRASRRPRTAAALPVVPSAFWPAAAAAAVLALLALAWIVPSKSGLFDLSDAEAQTLVPAPVSRRQLLIHRLLRSQIGLLFAAMVPALLITGPASSMSWGVGSPGVRILRGLALWVVFVTIRVYVAGVTAAREHLASTNVRARLAAWAPLVVTMVALAVVAVPLVRSFWWEPAVSATEAASRVTRLTTSGWSRVALWPLVLLMRPLFFDDPISYLFAMPGALGVMVLTLLWVVPSVERFQSEQDASRPRAQVRSAGTAARPRVVATAWTLALVGRTETLFAWKNAMQTVRTTNLLGLLPYVLPAAMLAVIGTTVRMSVMGARGLAAGLSMASLMIAIFCVVLGPQTMRGDLRGDLRHLELLKTWPVKSSALIRGELLWPTMCLTGIAWGALVCSTVFSAAAFPELTVSWRLSSAAAAFVIAPVLACAQLTVHNAAAVVFPAWVATGAQRPRGLDMMGQRLILFAGVLLALVVVVGPGVIAGGIVLFALYWVIGAVSLVPAALMCFVVVSVEILLATEMLGAAYDRIDLSQLERAE